MGCLQSQELPPSSHTIPTNNNAPSTSSSSPSSSSKITTSSSTRTRPLAPTSACKDRWEEVNWKEDTRAIWMRPLDQLPTYMDLPRLAKRMEIFDKDGNKLNEDAGKPNQAQTKTKLIHHLLTTLAEHLGDDDELIGRVRNSFFEYIHEDGSGEIAQQLKRFLCEVVGDSSRLGKVLRACHQKMVFS
jgi:hypothetical protein